MTNTAEDFCNEEHIYPYLPNFYVTLIGNITTIQLIATTNVRQLISSFSGANG